MFTKIITVIVSVYKSYCNTISIYGHANITLAAAVVVVVVVLAPFQYIPSLSTCLVRPLY